MCGGGCSYAASGNRPPVTTTLPVFRYGRRDKCTTYITRERVIVSRVCGRAVPIYINDGEGGGTFGFYRFLNNAPANLGGRLTKIANVDGPDRTAREKRKSDVHFAAPIRRPLRDVCLRSTTATPLETICNRTARGFSWRKRVFHYALLRVGREFGSVNNGDTNYVRPGN